MTWHDVLLPGQLIEALTAEAQQLRDELTTMRADKAAEIQRLHVALAAVGRRRRPTHQRRPVGIIILGFLVAMYVISDVIISSCLWHGSRRKFAARAQRNCTGGHSRAVYLHSRLRASPPTSGEHQWHRAALEAAAGLSVLFRPEVASWSHDKSRNGTRR